eukprot:6483921-Amphidinium_carterae.1
MGAELVGVSPEGKKALAQRGPRSYGGATIANYSPSRGKASAGGPLTDTAIALVALGQIVAVWNFSKFLLPSTSRCPNFLLVEIKQLPQCSNPLPDPNEAITFLHNEADE